MAHILDNVIWQALTSQQVEFAEACGKARRFVREVTSLTALAEESEEAYASLGELVGRAELRPCFLTLRMKAVSDGTTLRELRCSRWFARMETFRTTRPTPILSW